MVHFKAGPIIEASTQEWAIKKQLYNTNDTSAYINLAKVFAQRCIESGFFEMKYLFDREGQESTKVGLFVKTLEENGIVLEEPWFIMPEPVVNRYVGRKEKPYADMDDDDAKKIYFHNEHSKGMK
jgi:large subunit ribosomal protein L18